jgi:hypothetical protein
MHYLKGVNDMGINLDAMTVEDCVENYYRKNKCVVIANGHVIDIVDKESETK